MSRLRRLCSVAFSLVLASSLAACGGRSHSSSVVPSQANAQAPGATNPDSFKTAPATFTFTVPGPKTSSSKRSPKYLSSFTRDIYIQITSVKRHSDNAVLTPIAASYDVNVPAGPGSTAGPPAVTCVSDPLNANNFKCTTTLQMTIGDNTFDIQSWSGTNHTGSLLSEQKASQQIVQGTQNNLNYSLDGNAATITVSGTGTCTTGPVGTSFGSVGTTAVNFTVAYTDAAGGTLVSPGMPKLSVGTSAVTGGTITVNVNQAAQAFTLTPSAVGVSGTINVSSVQADSLGSSDGLAFTRTKSFTFTTGNAPPASFLALIEQTGANSGKIDLFTVDTSADTFAVSNVQGGGNVLAVTNSTNEGKPDIDNPRDILFDGTGDLLVANGGQGGAGGDFGSFACIPAGAISTGSTTTTTNSTNAVDPESIAYGTDNTITLGNVPASATYNTVKYVFGATTYTPAPLAQNIANPGGGSAVGATSVIPIPDLASGTYAAAITNGTTISKVVLKAPGGGETAITDPDIVDPTALGWDPTGHHMIISTHNGTSSKVIIYTVSGAPTKVTSFPVRNDGAGNSYAFGDKMAVSADGHIAVAGGTGDGPAELQVYTGAGSAVGVPIPFDAYTNSACTTGYFGNVTVVRSMRWLTNSKLLILLQANGAGKQGAYIADIGQLVPPSIPLWRFDVNAGTCNAVTGNSPKLTGFQAITNAPLSAAYKP